MHRDFSGNTILQMCDNEIGLYIHTATLVIMFMSIKITVTIRMVIMMFPSDRPFHPSADVTSRL